jgi:hypothetical protein
MQMQLSDFSQSTPSVLAWHTSRQGNDYEQYGSALASNFPQTTGLVWQQPAIYKSLGTKRLRDLQRLYTPVGAEELIVDLLAEVPVLFSLLKEAVDPIYAEFGDAIILQLRAQESDENVLLRVVIQSALNIEEAEVALERFEDAWWLDNCHKSSGSLVFDCSVRPAFSMAFDWRDYLELASDLKKDQRECVQRGFAESFGLGVKISKTATL